MGDILKDKLGNLTNKVKVGFVGTCEKYYTEDSTYPMIRTTNLKNSGVDLSDLKYVTKDFFDKNKKSQLNDGDVLVARFGTSGNACVYHGGPAQCLNAIIIEPNFEVTIPEFLALEINSRHVRNEVNRRIVGSTQNILNTKVLADIEISVPGLPEQARILKNVEKIEEIIQKRKKEIGLLDQIIKARFVEMFGSLEINDKDWEEKALGELCDKVVRYPTFYGMEYLESGTKVIRIGNILEDGHMETGDDNYVFVYDGVNNDFPETVIELNDIIMAVRGDGSAAKRIGIIREDELIGANISPNLIRIKVSNKMEPIFFFYYLTGEVGQKRLDAYVNKTAKKNIAAKDIVKVVVPVPPIKLQREFASFVAQVDKSKAEVQKSLDEAQLLFDSLMQQYFG